jgi:hypothetical protein
MGIFSNILQKLGLKKEEAPAAPQHTHIDTDMIAKAHAENTAAQAAKTAAVNAAAQVAAQAAAQAAAAAKPAAIPVVDVVSKLDGLAKANPQKLNWQVSIVDMLKLLDMDSSLEARKELAKELSCPAELIGGDYSQMNVWLHKTVLQKIAENGGNIPASLLK